MLENTKKSVEELKSNLENNILAGEMLCTGYTELTDITPKGTRENKIAELCAKHYKKLTDDYKSFLNELKELTKDITK